LKLASLFDGIGGFPLVATMLGIEPVWASEIEKNCIAVTQKHFPNMKHYGSVTELKGAEVEPVDIITFGSPCQDLSVAGKRAGMGEGTRSGLFTEAVRIIKEMRNANIRVERRPNSEMGMGSRTVNEELAGGICGNLRDTNDVGSECGEGNNATIESGGPQHGVHSNNGGSNGRYPRYAVWENVPGAFSSNKGEDFRAIIESLAKVAEEAVSIPLPKDGKWEPAGLVEGDGWSIAWRTLDAQFWGVPQRRKRIFLVADFGGDRASEIFFERESLSWNPAESGNEGQEVTRSIESGVRTAGFKQGNSPSAGSIGYSEEISPTLTSGQSGTNMVPAVYSIQGNIIDRDAQQNGSGICKDITHTINSTDRHAVCVTGERTHALKAEGFDGYNSSETGEKSATLGVNCGMSTGRNGVVCFEPRSQDGEPRIHESGICPTLNTAQGGQRQPCVCLHATQDPITAENRSHALGANSSQAVMYDASGSQGATLTANNGDSVNNQTPLAVLPSQTVRRLTPKEAERLQGFPDGWTEGLSDSARYKALGNSVAIPCVKFILECIRRKEAEYVFKKCIN